MPLALAGAARPISIEHLVEVPSAQVKSALLLAALNAPGRSRIMQAALTRDHTERMLRAFGADIVVEATDQGEAVTVLGEAELRPAKVLVPGDPSSAAFPVAAALIVPGSKISLPNLLLNGGLDGRGWPMLDDCGASGAGVAESGSRVAVDGCGLLGNRLLGGRGLTGTVGRGFCCHTTDSLLIHNCPARMYMRSIN